MRNNKIAFTLVELIVVITILAILATIGFVSFSGYLAGTRDTNRIAQLKSMSDALELYRTKKDLPIPDDKVDVQASGTTIAYQGYIGANVLETIEYTEKGLDPKDKTYFSYYLTKDKKYFQLLGFLEEANTDVVASNIFNNSQAVDYTNRFPKVTGKKLGILTDESNTPIQEISTITASGYLDLNDVGTTVFAAHISDEEIISGSGTTLASTNPTGSCKRIKQLKGSSSDGVYTIDPAGDGTGFEVYCDMTTDGGGWMRLKLQTRQWGTNVGWDSDPISTSYGIKVFGINSQVTLDDLTSCIGDSQVDLVWENLEQIIGSTEIDVLNSIFTEGFTSKYAAFDVDGVDRDQFKGCTNGVLKTFADGDEYGVGGNEVWMNGHSVDSITGIFTKGIYGGNANASGYNVSLPVYWYYR